MEQEKDLGGFFAVSPKTDCEHILEISENLADYSISSPCQECGDRTENWICLHCGLILCSRYKNSHMSLHYQNTEHKIAMSFTDLSFWCYGCESYVVSSALRPALKIFQDQKFPMLRND